MREKPVFKFIEDRFGNALIVWTNPPGLDVELSPTDALNLAALLTKAAQKAEGKMS